MDLKGKVALVTGASRGIGAATAKLLAAKGASVGVNYATRSDLAEKVVHAINAAVVFAATADRSAVVGATHASPLQSDRHPGLARRAQGFRAAAKTVGGRAIAIQADVSDKAQVRRMVDRVVQEFGRLDVLVNNAGGPAHGAIETVTEDTWRKAIATHLDGPFHCTRAAIPHMKKNAEGAIVNLSSVAAIRGCPGSVAYQMVKCAILAFTRGCARDLADCNIRVNSVSPGIIRTDFHAAMTEEQKKFNLEKRIPLHREGKPEQVAEAILLLVSNDYMTGENIVVDAGLTMRIA